MEEIEKWFESLEYNAGVMIYKSLPSAKMRIVQKLERGKNNHNMAQLIKELRVYKSLYKSSPSRVIPQTAKEPSTLPGGSSDKEVATFFEKKQLKESSQKVEFGSIRYGELPPELRGRYQDAAQLFYKMCDLKFILNDLPKASTDEALSIQLQLEELDDKREHIWKELHHWQNHKTLLPSTTDSFEGLSTAELFKKRNNLRSQVTKLNKRIDTYYENLTKESDKHQIKLIERQINRSEKKLHQHTLNIDKLKDLL